MDKPRLFIRPITCVPSPNGSRTAAFAAPHPNLPPTGEGVKNPQWTIWDKLDRITQDPAVMGGKPCIRGMRVTVGSVVGQIAAGCSVETILATLFNSLASMSGLLSLEVRTHRMNVMTRLPRAPIALATLLLLSTVAVANPPATMPLPEIPPPPGMVDPGLEPEVSIRHRGEERVEEYRVRGRLYMIKVTPPHGRPYYLLNLRGDGRFTRMDDLSPNFQVPMWVVTEF